jgi:hypothetical protein
MTYWTPLVVEGVRHDLSHLEPFEFYAVPNGSDTPVTISVRFHDHCFTQAFSAELHASPIVTNQTSRNEQRAFDPRRYALSLNLPELVRSLAGKRISSTRKQNLVRIELANGVDYGIFFTLRRESARRCSLFVVSAYALDRPRQSVVTTGEMHFTVTLALVLKGKVPNFPPKRRN